MRISENYEEVWCQMQQIFCLLIPSECLHSWRSSKVQGQGWDYQFDTTATPEYLYMPHMLSLGILLWAKKGPHLVLEAKILLLI